jgi:hypothetical protein
VCELSALGPVALDRDGLTGEGLGYEDLEDRVGSHAEPVGRAQTKGDNRHVPKPVGGEQHALAGQLGDVVGVVGLAGMLLVDRLVDRVAVDLPGRRVHDPGPGLLGGEGDVGAPGHVHRGGQFGVGGGEIDVADGADVDDDVMAAHCCGERPEVEKIADDRLHPRLVGVLLVVPGHVETVGQHCPRDVLADESCGTRHQCLHGESSL